MNFLAKADGISESQGRIGKERAPMTINPTLSVVVPMHNEAACTTGLVAEIAAAAGHLPLLEILCVDDGSTDDTRARLVDIQAQIPSLRILAHPRKSGQSAGIVTGVRAARGAVIATLDGDGQNDPADISKLYEAFVTARTGSGPVLVAGQRAIRRDDAIRRLSSRIANAVRSALLGDGVSDTGCGLKLFARADFLTLPAFNHMHRYLPALYVREGGHVVLVPVGHRARTHGRSKYGVWDRLSVAIADLTGVLWLLRRPVNVRDSHEIGAAKTDRQTDVRLDASDQRDKNHAAVA